MEANWPRRVRDALAALEARTGDDAAIFDKKCGRTDEVNAKPVMGAASPEAAAAPMGRQLATQLRPIFSNAVSRLPA